MLLIPDDILTHFDAVLKKRAVPYSSHKEYKKWLRYYLDFCGKYPLPDSNSERVKLFIDKLRQKKQTPKQQEQAAHAVSLLFEMLNAETKSATISTSSQYRATTEGLPLQVSEAATTPATPFIKGEFFNNLSRAEAITPIYSPLSDMQQPHSVSKTEPAIPKKSAGSRYNEWRCLAKSGSPAWDKIIDNLAAEIKIRHYSRKTLKAYENWSRKFQSYLRNKPPDELSATDVKAYITYLAVNCKVAASTQNQAFNALLFLFRHILKKDFGDHKDIPRAKKSTYIPVVLSRKEIDAVLKHLGHPYDLAVKLLYGCGLRLFECVTLRVKNFNFDAGILTVHGKGSKDRTVPIPQTIMPELTAQFEAMKKLYDEDLAAG